MLNKVSGCRMSSSSSSVSHFRLPTKGNELVRGEEARELSLQRKRQAAREKFVVKMQSKALVMPRGLSTVWERRLAV